MTMQALNAVEVPWLLLPLYWILGVGFGYGVLWFLARMRFTAAERTARHLIEDAKRDAENLRKEGQLQARDETLKAREAFEKESWSRRQELLAIEDRINQREIALERRATQLHEKETAVDKRQEELDVVAAEQARKEADGQRRIDEEIAHLHLAAKLSQDDLKNELIARMEKSLQAETAEMVRRSQEQVKAQSERIAREIIAIAIERYAADQSNEMTTATVIIPSEEMKGRIIGKEGRNIRTFEAATGVNLVIDDTPGVVIVSGFDPLRREVARVSLERLIQDGRIQPTRIEEIVAKVREELEQAAYLAGESAIRELGLTGVDPEVVKLLGCLKYRHSYGQNVLKHSIEMAKVMGMMASELGADADVARRAGLLHDLGKAMDPQQIGSHALAGAEFLRKHGESEVVCNAVAAHHDEVQPESIIAALTKAGDALTAARPGARSESTEAYLQRLAKLEKIVNAFPGVEKSYAIQAGREVRVIVRPEVVSDEATVLLARDITKRISDELDFPGQIRVTLVRETRVVEYAR